MRPTRFCLLLLAALVTSTEALQYCPTRACSAASTKLETVRRSHTIVAQGNKWLQAQEKRKEAERAMYEAAAERAEAQKKAQADAAAAESAATEQAKREAAERAAYYQDNLDLSRPGGVMRPTNAGGVIPGGVTRGMLQNARKTTSPAILADEKVKEALDSVGSMPAAEAVALLGERLGQARAAGVRETMPNFKKALALMAQLDVAAGGGSGGAAVDAKKSDPQKNEFDALFGEGYAVEFPDDLGF